MLALILGAAALSPGLAPAELAREDEPEGGLMASPVENVADLEDVWSDSELGDVIPNSVAAAADPEARPALTRIPKPILPPGPRRIGIQAGHWLTELAPPELWRLLESTGTSWAGINERDINLDMAERVAAILREKGYVVDVLPTTIPAGYLGDAFVALHGDGDGVGWKSGFKLAHSARRTPYEDALLEAIRQEYGEATGLAYDTEGITRAMTNYYAHSWSRVTYSTAPHTPSVILEMGFVSNDHDRFLMTQRADVLAEAIARGVERFLEAHPRSTLFGEDLLVPSPRFRFPTPSPPGG